MGYLNLKRRVGAWCLPARARERSVNIEPREGRQGPGGDRIRTGGGAPARVCIAIGGDHGFRQKMEG